MVKEIKEVKEAKEDKDLEFMDMVDKVLDKVKVLVKVVKEDKVLVNKEVKVLVNREVKDMGKEVKALVKEVRVLGKEGREAKVLDKVAKDLDSKEDREVKEVFINRSQILIKVYLLLIMVQIFTNLRNIKKHQFNNLQNLII